MNFARLLRIFYFQGLLILHGFVFFGTEHFPKVYRKIVRLLARMLRIAVGLDRSKNQLVETVACNIDDKKLTITVAGSSDLDLEIWAARRNSFVLGKGLDRRVKIISES